VPFTERDIQLLADLQAYNKNPYGAAELLAQAMGQGKVKASGANYRKLFQFWLLAREKDKSGKALMKAAKLSGDIELYLYLAQLQMEQRDWQPMHQTMLAACADQLQDKYVSRANLLLGVSQLKLGDSAGARRSFINATLIGGANAQAGQWLDFMNAEPATKDEVRRIVGICYGAQDKRAKVVSAPSGRSAATAEEGAAEPAGPGDIQIKTVPAMRIFYARHDIPLAELAAKLKSLAVRLNINMVKAGGGADGPIQIISSGDSVEGEQASFELAIPTSGSPTARGKYRVRKLASFKCAYLVYEGPPGEMLAAGIALGRTLQAAGYELTGERRMVLVGSGNAIKLELQLGIE
jgi:effector-binding domain-containing protein